MKNRTCTKCGEQKPPTGFYKDANCRDGLNPQCKACMAALNKKWREANPERYRAYRRAWEKEKRKRYPKRVAAREAAGYAIRTGKLKRPDSCSDCKRPCKPQAHHPDYSRPLDVVWLCRSCHRELHAAEA